jgi:hypothetical protein
MIVTTPETVVRFAGEVILILAADAAAGLRLSAAIKSKKIAFTVKTGICHCGRPAAAFTQNSTSAPPHAQAGMPGQRA